jgi:hypothetical protein
VEVARSAAAAHLHDVLHVALQHAHAVRHAPDLDVELAQLDHRQPLAVSVLHSAFERLDGIVRLAQDPAASVTP